MKYVLIAVWLSSSGQLTADPWREFDRMAECVSEGGRLPLQADKNNRMLLIAGCRQKDNIPFRATIWGGNGVE